MNGFRKAIFYLAAAAALTLSVFTSCKKDDTLHYNNVTMGNIVDGRFVSDQGNIFNIVDQQCSGQLDTMKRALVICDVLNKTAQGKDNEYDIRLNGIVTVLTKDIVPSAGITEEIQVQDPIRIEEAWISGGYINLYIMFPIKVGSKTMHLINLVHEGCIKDAATGEDMEGTYCFTLRHNSFEDKVTSDKDLEYVLAGGYVSFPLNSFITESKADFLLNWVVGTDNSDESSPKPVTQSLRGKYTTDSYQHSPRTTNMRTARIK